jgi:predicted CoA-binding protein
VRDFGEGRRDPRLYGDDDTVRDVLAQSRLWFVVGLSDNRMRAAYRVARDLQSKGCHVVPVHPRAARTLGESGYPTVAAAAAVHGPPDVVDVFVRSSLAGQIADEALAVGAGAVWFQLGVVDEGAARRVRSAGVPMVMDRCPTVEWPLLGPAA